MGENLNKPTKIWIALMKIGAFSGCHQMYERSFQFRGYQFPVCARCTGLFLGNILSLPFYFWVCKLNTAAITVIAAVSVVLLGIDGVGQLKSFWVSTNLRRILTGIFCGFFVASLFLRIVSHFFF